MDAKEKAKKLSDRGRNLCVSAMIAAIVGTLIIMSLYFHTSSRWGGWIATALYMVLFGLVLFSTVKLTVRGVEYGRQSDDIKQFIHVRKHNRFWRLLAGVLPADQSVESQFAEALKAEWVMITRMLKAEGDARLWAVGWIYGTIHAERPGHERYPELNTACNQVIYSDDGFCINWINVLANYVDGGLEAVLLPEEESLVLMRPSSASADHTTLLHAAASSETDESLLLRIEL